MADVYIVEDEPGIRAAVVRALEERGHTVRSTGKGLDCLAAVVDAPPDVVVLDLGLPDLDGAQVLKMLRAASSVPVIIATARADENEVIALLNAGADDYVIKPYSGAQLEARVRAVLRRLAVETTPRMIVVGPLQIDLAAHAVTVDGQPVELSRKEYELLVLLASHRGEVVTRREMLAEVWRQPYGGSEKTVDVHLSWVRRKLGESADEPRFLRTVRGVGVMMVEPCAEN